MDHLSDQIVLVTYNYNFTISKHGVVFDTVEDRLYLSKLTVAGNRQGIIDLGLESL
jgi:hypothetical protein